MTTHPVKQLYELQKLDSTISSLQESLSKVRSGLQDESAIAAARQLVASTELPLSQVTAVRREADHAQQALEEKLHGIKDRLYGGTVTNTRELSGLEKEREVLQRRRDKQEERLLEVMLEVEDIQESLRAAQKALLQVEAQRAIEHEELLKEEHILTDHLEALSGQRSRAVQAISPQSVTLYESLRKSRGGRAVARVERGQCQGCRLALPTKDLQRARIGDSVVQCNSCQRIVYVG